MEHLARRLLSPRLATRFLGTGQAASRAAERSGERVQGAGAKGQGNGGAAWAPAALARYEGILARMPFGLPPPPPATPPPAAPPATPPPPPFATKLTLCAINRTPMGSLAVGFTDASQNPIHSYYLDVGETQDGFTAVSADFDQECAEIAKDGTTITLWLNASKRDVKAGAGASTTRPSPLALARTETKPTVPDGFFRQPNRPMFTNAVEQLLSMELSVPPGTDAPPLPIVDDMPRDTRKALSSVIVIETNDTEAVAAHKENIGWAKAELKSHIQEGGSTSSYLQTLKARRAAEIARQKEAREQAEARIRDLANKLSTAEMEKQLEEVNKTLTDNGVEPIDAPE